MTQFSQDKAREENELLGRLCNEEIDAAGRNQLSEMLAGDVEAQKCYVTYLDLHVAMRAHARALDDEDFTLLEAQAALDAIPAACADKSPIDVHDGTASSFNQESTESSTPAIIPFASRWTHLRLLASRPLAWTVSAAVLLVGFSFALLDRPDGDPQQSSAPANQPANAPPADFGTARLRGTVGARWAGAKLEMPEGERFEVGQRLELIEGLAEVRFGGGASIVLQGPTIFEIRGDSSAAVSVGRVATIVPSSASPFTIHAAVADVISRETEFGAEVDVDGSLVSQVYKGDVEIRFNHSDAPKSSLQLASGQVARVDAATGRAVLLDQPSKLHFVRYLPVRETLINLADVVAGEDGQAKAYHRGISLADGQPVDDYGAPAHGDGQYHKTVNTKFVDGVFIPDGKRGPVQVDSIGRSFSDFPPTKNECWGARVMARRPKEERSLPFIRLEMHDDTYGYVNWLHIASKPDELSPQGLGLIGMHSNCGMTFDLHAIRAQYPNKKMQRFRSLVGNLESKPGVYAAEAWVIVDGQLRYHRKAFSREDGPETIDLPLTDRDRFLVLVVTDADGDTAYDWVAFGDPVIEMMNLEEVSAGADTLHKAPQSSNSDKDAYSLPQRNASTGNRGIAVTNRST